MLGKYAASIQYMDRLHMKQVRKKNTHTQNKSLTGSFKVFYPAQWAFKLSLSHPVVAEVVTKLNQRRQSTVFKKPASKVMRFLSPSEFWNPSEIAS